jgi:D-alanyl-D-alanine dipeptidase
MLIEITPETFDVELEIAYATANNFTGQLIYRRPRALLHPDAAEKLQAAIILARRLGYRFRVYDAFRPLEAQWALWRAEPGSPYVADPRRGGPHTRGVAVDLTLLDRTGQPLDMGGPFDELSENAWHEADVSEAAQRNRHLLLGLMTAAGWDCYLKEWWHYQLFNPREYPVLSNADANADMM